jgi:hypothetical protein
LRHTHNGSMSNVSTDNVDPLANLDDLLERTPQSKITQQRRLQQNRVNQSYSDDGEHDDSEVDEEDKQVFEERRKIYNEWVLKPFLMGMFGAIGMSVGTFLF